MKTIQIVQQQYISEWHDYFVKFIGGLLGIVETMMTYPSATDEDKNGFYQIKLLLHGKEAQEVEKALRDGNISKSVLNKIEKLDKALVDFAIEHLRTDVIVKEFLKQLAYLKIAHDKKVEENTLKALNIPIGGE